MVCAPSRLLGAGIAAAALAGGASAGGAHPVVARVHGEEVRCEAPAVEACAQLLVQRLRQHAEPAYIAAHGLAATDAEVAALEAYNRQFAQRDRDQRAAKLIEIEQRLAQASALGPERE